MQTSRIIVVTGGVVSGLGKGVAAASIGRLLESNHFRVIPIKCDGYLNVDPGTMNPFEHGEVFVLEDGAETDMDFGHYERFLHVNMKKDWSITTGKVFLSLIDQERQGKFLGKTVQMIPHVTAEIKNRILSIGKEEHADFVIVEVGGTVGDIENQLFLEAMRELQSDVGRDNVLFVHLSYVPVLDKVGEQKSKPTQQSVNLLKERGIFPEIILGRAENELEDSIKDKIALFCNVKREAVISAPDQDNIYRIPLQFEKEGLLELIGQKFHFLPRKDLQEWRRLVHTQDSATQTVRIAIAGKYTKLHDSYASVDEALHHAGANLGVKVETVLIETKDADFDAKDALESKKIDGVIIPGGFGSRGIEGKIQMIQHCRENNIPLLGICYGLQLQVVEFARSKCGLADANTTEVNPHTNHPVIDFLPDQVGLDRKGATMRLGAYPSVLKPDTQVSQLYGNQLEVNERHRHRFEVNPAFHEQLTSNGLVFSGMSPSQQLVEFIELPLHPFFVGTQAHPEFKSKLDQPAPLFYGLVKAAIAQKAVEKTSLPVTQ